jgi:hypothetical protein
VRVSESAYASKLRDLSSNFASVESSFAGLEERFTDVGRTALQTGEQLQTVDRLKTRAAEASDLIEYYYQFARGDTARLDRLRKEGGREGRLRTAVIARRLAAIAREVDMPGAEQVSGAGPTGPSGCSRRSADARHHRCVCGALRARHAQAL